MKIRNGFVSNSSSSSFIVKEKDLHIIQKANINFVKVQDMLKDFEMLEKSITNIETKYINNLYDAFSDIKYSFETIHNTIIKLKGILLTYGTDIYITDSYDRDYAYRLGFNFEVYKGDL
jgi:hypothetical protein